MLVTMPVAGPVAMPVALGAFGEAEEEVLDLIATDENIFGVMDVNEEQLPEATSEDMSPEDIEAAIAAELGGGKR